MQIKLLTCAILATAALSLFAAKQASPTVSGDYLEVRSCDVYTGPCFANAEMGLTGKEGILVWKVRQGIWRGTSLEGLSVIAVIKTDGTLGDLRYEPRSGRAVLIVDAKADAQQRAALTDLAKTMAGRLISEVSEVKSSAIEMTVGGCSKAGCASVMAPNLVGISTRCFGDKDHICGNEDTFYPPLTDVDAKPAFTELAAYSGSGLDLTWQSVGTRSAFLGTFGM
ncbi:MAG: DUF1326 domain-containing protein [Verrucomicrobia bacterium]|nr:DUF1326 domain-containing protein [Verrucomicrobiota bacterium]